MVSQKPSSATIAQNFKSVEFENLPYHLALNGQAERAVRAFKVGVEEMEVGNMQEKLPQFLLEYRSIPHLTRGVAPAELTSDPYLVLLTASMFYCSLYLELALESYIVFVSVFTYIDTNITEETSISFCNVAEIKLPSTLLFPVCELLSLFTDSAYMHF